MISPCSDAACVLWQVAMRRKYRPCAMGAAISTLRIDAGLPRALDLCARLASCRKSFIPEGNAMDQTISRAVVPGQEHWASKGAVRLFLWEKATGGDKRGTVLFV